MAKKKPTTPSETPGTPSNPATGVLVVVGGWADNRPQAEWKPEDGFAPTAVLRGGRQLKRRQCCAWRIRQVGKARCTRAAAPHMRVCRMHGGAPGSGRPPIHGRYSKVLGAIRDVYHRHLDRETASDPTDELALMRATIERLVDRALKRDTADFRAAALAVFERAAEAARTGDQAETSARFKELGDMLRAGKAVDEAMAEVFNFADRTAARATDFRRARAAEMRVWTEAHIIVLLRMIAETIREHAPIDIAVSIQSALDRRLAVAQGHPSAPGG